MSSVINTREMAASAELLHERIRNGHATEPPDDGAGEDGPVDRETIEDLGRLTGVEDVERYVHFREWPDDEELPEWVGTFTDLLDFFFEVEDPHSSVPDFEEELPFEQVLYGFASFATRELLAEGATDSLSETALEQFQHHLMDRIVDASGLPMHRDFVAYVAERDSEVISEQRLSPDSTEWYDDYVSDFFQGRAMIFFEEYPVLARLVAVVMGQWATLVSEFASRLAADREAIESLLGTEDLGRVASVRPGAGDPHDGGQTVVVAEFESGDGVVYKPRSVGVEVAFYRFQEWLQRELDGFPTLQTPGVVEGSGYGWVEKVERGSFPDVDALRDYYRGAGALLCVLYVLDASDCHYENLVAGEDSPVAVDAETVMHAHVPIEEIPDVDRNEKVREWVVRDTVLDTMLLPYAMDGHRNDRSGLATTERRSSQVIDVAWEHVNTDAIDFDYARPPVVPEDNFPTFEGEPAPPDHFVDEIAAGFDAAYEAIQASKDDVAQEVTDRFSGLQVRHLLQPTELYRALQRTLSNPDSLRDGVVQEYEVRDTLAERWAESSFVQQRTDEVVRAEAKALFRRDVPRFSLRTDANELTLGDTEVPTDLFGETGVEGVRERIQGLSEDDRTYQRSLIELSLGDFRLGYGADGGAAHE